MMVITVAPSLVGYENDCCISYTVTIVDVRSCTRCTRVPAGPHEHQGTVHYCAIDCKSGIVLSVDSMQF